MGDSKAAVFPNAGVARSAPGCLRHVTESMPAAVEIPYGAIRNVLVNGAMLRNLLHVCVVS